MQARTRFKKLSWWKLCLIPYALLALIPTTTGLMSGYYYLTGDMPRARGWMLFTITGYLSLPFSVIVNISLPFQYMFDWDQRWLMHYISVIWANATIAPFVKPHITGLENIPHGDDQAVVFVSNHQSWLDIYSYLTFPELHLRFVSKAVIAHIPVVGWSLSLLGHITFDRKDPVSSGSLLERCAKVLRGGVPVFFFPEGTRSRDQRLLPFKIGAFKLALDEGVPIVPLTITGTGDMMPPRHETELELGEVHIVVHPPIMIRPEDTVTTLRDRTRAAITSALPPHLQPDTNPKP